MSDKQVIIGEWRVDPDTNRLTGPAGEVELEPRVMDLLMLFARQPGTVISKPDMAAALWGDVHVNDDALTRSIFKLRKALGDDARNTRYIETVPKRGYRLVADVSGTKDAAGRGVPKAALAVLAILLLITAAIAGWWLTRPTEAPDQAGPQAGRLERADDFYNQFTRTNNEAALQLYQDVLKDDPESAAALAGLANALTQRLIRYEGLEGNEGPRTTLTQALESGWLETETARAGLQRAVALARRATDNDPSLPRAWRALGLALAASRDFEAALSAYERALVIDPDDWGTMINLSELYRLIGQPELSTPYLEQAWAAMERRYADDPVGIHLWHSATGLTVAENYAEVGNAEEAELWYRRVLSLDPLNAEAVRGLASLLDQYGDPGGADALCAELERVSGETCAAD